MGNFAKINNGPISGDAPPGSLGIDLATPALYIAGNSNVWTEVGAGGLPTASAAGQVPVSTGAGTTYAAQVPGLTLISRQILLAAAGTVTFSAIPQIFTNLRLVITASSAAAGTIGLQFNGDTGANYTTQELLGTGSSPFAALSSAQTSVNAGVLGTTPGATTIDIPGYSGTVLNKALVSLSGQNTGAGFVALDSGSWNNAAAVTAVALLAITGTFAIGSTFSLYGLN